MKHKPYGIYEKNVKWPLDFFLSLFLILILFPVLFIIAVLIKIKLGSPVLFTQDRPGKDEIIFKLYKFRTMTDKRDENGVLLPDSLRLTSFGLWLRSSSLDELPEFMNVLKGDMSIVGPRPLLVRYLPFYNAEERVRHSVRPGLTGLAQINGRNNLNWDDRLKLDVEYVNHISFIDDCKIILKTVGKVLRRSDVLSGDQLVMKDLDIEREGKCESIYGNQRVNGK